jgi:hypothetical protein
MELSREGGKQKTVKHNLFDLVKQGFFHKNLDIVGLQHGDQIIEKLVEKEEPKQTSVESTTETANFMCRTCKVSFDELEPYQQHYKTEWHRFLI